MVPADGFTPDDWRRVTATQLDAPFFLSTAIHRAGEAAGAPGSHVFIGSLTSLIGLPNMAAYGAAKSGSWAWSARCPWSGRAVAPA